ncbi:Bis-tetraphosphatase, symmetrical [Podospora aff. communis PSN243]|uniref:Bis-tetraphosphatase, symmetrical n=1 Tax=Podospora aff. communis PSN243 TaxID=3040156 RepID=A0AAV9GZ15_9PEZI|nr:Bis-tetraphosphatase, symmetrical [Podospora aff. communis PSN243]
MTFAGRPHQRDRTESTPHLFNADAAGGVPSRQRPLGESDPQMPLSMADEPADRPPVADLPDAVIAELPAEHAISPPALATESKPGTRKRLVFIGDVHGRISALQALLEKIGFDHRHGDHLVFVGDIVTKGPDSAGVIKLALDVGASGVRGNHDDNVLMAYKALQKKEKHHKKKHRKSLDMASEDVESKGDGEGTDTEGETARLTAAQTKHADHARAVARSLSPKQIKWLSSLPIALRIGRVSNTTSEDMPWNAGEIVVVHAGLVPGVPLEQQDPWAMMNMRTLLYPALKTASDETSDAETLNEGTIPDETLVSKDDSEESTTTTDDLLAVPSDARHGEPWAHAWNRYQNTAIPSPADRTIVIYGHDARAGLQADVDITHRRAQLEAEKKRGKTKHGKKKKKKGTKGIRYAFGLDSGCGHGRQLTALVLEAGPRPEDGVFHRIEQVECGEVDS